MKRPKALPLSLLAEITYNFADEQRIGIGGFAVVYKGTLENKTVAVKRMSNTYMYEKEFQREVECLMIVKHKNVVRFLGYCADTQGSMEKYDGKFVMADVQQRLLCFEYLPKGSLHQYITDTSSGLRWRERYQIIMGICQGLHYLHQKNILHLDLKPANILLDDNWVPKITDFGISRCFDQIQSQVVTKISGTPGYLAPESFNHTEVTYRNSCRLDIYSLGVVIIEILTGKKGYHDVEKIVESWGGMLEESQCEVQMQQVRLCAEIGIDCTNFDPTKRPDTEDIISRLDEIECFEGYIKTGVSTSYQINPEMLIGTGLTLWLKYQQLNPDIRRCLEYCVIFPKESKLGRHHLVRLWIAQSFIKTSCCTEDMEDVAEGYIQELVSYSFLQPEGTGSDTDCFTIHDVLYDMLDKVARNCFRIENARSDIISSWKGDVPRDCQHLFIRFYDGDLITHKILGLENLRTLIFYVVENTIVKEKVIDRICKRLKKLRVLAIHFSKEHDPIGDLHSFSVPESIGQLKCICYFAFRTKLLCTVILPSTLNKLHHIQVLDFGDCNDVEFSFAGVINLQHIICSCMNFPNIGRLISLQTIPKFEIRYEQWYEVKQLRLLNKLRGRLEIEGLDILYSKEEALEANLAAKARLTALKLSWDRYYKRCSPTVLVEVLEGLCPPVGLETLEIWYYRGSRYPDWMEGKQNGPKDLQKLLFSQCNYWAPVPQVVEAFPHLTVLQIWWCWWKALPDNLERLTTLKYLEICGCIYIRSLPTLPQSLEEFRLRSGNSVLEYVMGLDGRYSPLVLGLVR